MNFKKIKSGIGITLCSLLIYSCNEVLDTEPSSTFDENTVWGSKSTIDAFVYGVYSTVWENYAGSTTIPATESWTPNCSESNLTSQTNNFCRDLIDNSTDRGFNEFALIRRCNLIIERSAESESLNTAEKTQLIAEGHLLRALVFYYQAVNMGRFVPILEVLDSEDAEAFATPLTVDVAESYNLIMDDMDIAGEGLPETSEPGRCNKWAAYAFKSRMALTAYAYTKDSKYLDICIESAEAVINNGNYSLDTDYESIFNQDGAYSSKEIIMARYWLKTKTTVQSCGLVNLLPNIGETNLKQTGSSPLFNNKNGQTFEAWGIYFPTQNLVDQYLVIDQNTGEAKPWYETSQFTSAVTDIAGNFAVGSFADPSTWSNPYGGTTQGFQVPSTNDLGTVTFSGTYHTNFEKLLRAGKITTESGKNISQLMYENRDQRFYGTIVYDSCYWLQDELVTTKCYGNAWAACRPGQENSWYTTNSNYYWRKGVYDLERAYYSVNTDFHIVLARLGEVYLNLAEAYLLKENYTKAVEYLNETRVTHGGLPESDASSLTEAIEDYMRERRIDMAFENDYYWSLLRWGKYGWNTEGNTWGGVIKPLNEPVYKIQISPKRDRYFVSMQVTNKCYDRNWSSRRYLFPIPQGQIDTRSAYDIYDSQNEGW